MEQLPEVLQRHIASFLPYDQRVEVNKYIPNEYKYIKKIDSDSHNLFVKTQLMKSKFDRFHNAFGLERIRVIKNVYTYLLNTKDDCLFTMTSERFNNTLRITATQNLLNDNYSEYIRTHHWKHVRALRSVCERLISKAESKKLVKECESTVKPVEIL